jgi:NAD(P)-dependent dehydrogenase (short-subunit alcohol dehydrogenase family)
MILTRRPHRHIWHHGCMTAPDSWTATDVPDQTGRTVIVTGANGGIGVATTELLAARGAHVIMAVRDESRGHDARARLLERHPEASLQVRRIDLVDLDSVREFADGIRRDGVAVDVLINNAGVMLAPRQLTPQGHELHFATNHLGHFALTGLLDILGDRKAARVVTVSSLMHRAARIRFDDLTGARRYSRFAAYGQSKLANVLFGLELDRRVRAAGSPVRSLVTNPGYVATGLQASHTTGALRLMLRAGNRLLAQNATTGALAQVRAATDPDVEGGQFLAPAGRSELRGPPRPVRPAPAAADPDIARRLWELSEQLTGVRYDLPPA